MVPAPGSLEDEDGDAERPAAAAGPAKERESAARRPSSQLAPRLIGSGS